LCLSTLGRFLPLLPWYSCRGTGCGRGTEGRKVDKWEIIQIACGKMGEF
jgi:hypothetical protein